MFIICYGVIFLLFLRIEILIEKVFVLVNESWGLNDLRMVYLNFLMGKLCYVYKDYEQVSGYFELVVKCVNDVMFYLYFWVLKVYVMLVQIYLKMGE